MQERVKFLTAFVQRPFDTGSITPSSAELAAAMVEGLGIETADCVVELGAGTGVFTQVIHSLLKPGASFLSFEINPDLVGMLQGRFPRARIINDSVEHLRRYLDEAGQSRIDAAVSGLPWAAFSTERQRLLLDPVVDALATGGKFATFAYSHAAWLPPGRRFRELLERKFATVETSSVVWRNLPPAFVYRCRK